MNEEQYEMQMQRTIVDLQEILPFFEIFFETQVDDAEKPPTGQLMNAIIHGFSTGEWLLVKDKSSGTILGVVYLAYGHPGRDCQLTVCPFSDDLDLKKVVDYIFSSGKNHPPHSYFKIKAKSPASWKTETIFVRAGFQPVGRYEADGLLQGKLSTIISYECFHPTWAKASGEELDED